MSPLSGSLCGHPLPSLPVPALTHDGPHPQPLTERCWNSQALMMLVADWRGCPFSCSSAAPGPAPHPRPRRQSWARPYLHPARLLRGGSRVTSADSVSGEPSPQTPPDNPAILPRRNPNCCLAANLGLTPTCPLFLQASLSPGSLELSPLCEARPPLDGPRVPSCRDPLSSRSLIHVSFWKTRAGSQRKARSAVSHSG